MVHHKKGEWDEHFLPANLVHAITSSIRAVLREPLLHFLLGGAGLFLLFNIVSDSETSRNDEIIVTSGQIEHLVTLFAKTRQRAPSETELSGLVENFILEEVLYREALAIGLDRDDTIIRRRLRQKIEFLLDDFTMVEPSDADLQLLLGNEPDRFRRDALISFNQISLGNKSLESANSTLASLQAGVSDPSSLSESYLMPYRFDDASESTVSAQFGDAFTAALFELETPGWTGPIDSPFGLHLVRVARIVPRSVPALADIRAVVEREWLVDFRAAAQQQIIEQMKAKYIISVESYEVPGQ